MGKGNTIRGMVVGVPKCTVCNEFSIADCPQCRKPLCETHAKEFEEEPLCYGQKRRYTSSGELL